MGRFLLSDRHGIFARFSRRKITWLGVICITELDLVTRHYPLPPPPTPPPLLRPKHTDCVCCPHCTNTTIPPPSYIKQQISKLTFSTAPLSLQSPGQRHPQTCQQTSVKEKTFCGCMWLCACLCVPSVFCVSVRSGKSILLSTWAKKERNRKE